MSPIGNEPCVRVFWLGRKHFGLGLVVTPVFCRRDSWYDIGEMLRQGKGDKQEHVPRENAPCCDWRRFG